MTKLRFTLALCASTLSFGALAVALMTWGNEDEQTADSGAARAAELEGYFAQMSKIHDMSNQEFEESVFGLEQDSAKSYAEAFDAVLALMQAEYEEISPPSAVKEEHEALVAAIKEYRLGIDHGLRPLAFDAPAAEFEGLFEDVLADEDLRVTGAFCAVQEVATAEGIRADVGCQRT